MRLAYLILVLYKQVPKHAINPDAGHLQLLL